MSSDDPERQNGMMVTFRLAGSEDAKKLAEIRCKSWKSAYRGIYPDEMLDCFDFAGHEKRFRKQIQDAQTAVYVIQSGGRAVGYVTLSRREGYKGFNVCMDSLYLMPEAQESDALPWNLYGNNAEKWDIRNSITAAIHIITGPVPFIRQWAARWETGTITIKILHGISGIMSIGWSERIFRG